MPLSSPNSKSTKSRFMRNKKPYWRALNYRGRCVDDKKLKFERTYPNTTLRELSISRTPTSQGLKKGTEYGKLLPIWKGGVEGEKRRFQKTLQRFHSRRYDPRKQGKVKAKVRSTEPQTKHGCEEKDGSQKKIPNKSMLINISSKIFSICL